jgi:hypothetical protein
MSAGVEDSATSWSTILFGILTIGIAVKLCWLLIGLYQLRRYRRAAVPLTPLPDSIREARQLTGADARFCVSRAVTGPATLGHTDPVVLLPESFRTLDVDSQRSVACHELLHVRREDWLATIVEEIVGALLWFNPGAWWLIAQAKLTREQLVDAEVVKLTDHEPYIEALLSMAVVSRKRWALPAAPFFTEGHLVRRLRLLMKGSGHSALRLCVSYGSVLVVLAACLWSVFLWFPIIGEPQLVVAAQIPTRHVVVHISAPPYAVVGGPGDSREFNIAVDRPAGAVRDVVYFVQRTGFNGSLTEETGLFPPPPPPPPPPPLRAGAGPFGFLAIRGVRMFQPGEMATSEEIQRLREALGEQAQVDIDQAEDGTVRRISVQPRRLSNEADVIRAVVPAVAAEPSASTHRVD